MSRGDLQEMEASTKQSKTAVNANAKPADPMPTMADPGTQLGSVEDLGGPTPYNYKPDDDSAKLKEPKLATVKDVVTKGAKPADPMPKGMKEDEEVDTEATIEEDQEVTDEVVEESNRLNYGLAAYAYTNSAKTAQDLGQKIESGQVSINHHGLGLVDTPFGGVKESGLGREGSKYGIDDFIEIKYVNMCGLDK